MIRGYLAMYLLATAVASCVASCGSSSPVTKAAEQCTSPVTLARPNLGHPHHFQVHIREQQDHNERILRATIKRTRGADDKIEDEIMAWSSSDGLDLRGTRYALRQSGSALEIVDLEAGPHAGPLRSDRLAELTARTLLERASNWPKDFLPGSPPPLKVGDRWEVESEAGTRVRWRLRSLVACKATLVANGSVSRRASGDLAAEGVWDLRSASFESLRGRLSLGLEDRDGTRRTLSSTFERTIRRPAR